MKQEKDSDICKATPKEMYGNGLRTSQEENDIEKYLKDFEVA